MRTLVIDFETRSTVNLSQEGMYRYFESETTDVLMASAMVDGVTTFRWVRGDAVPSMLWEHVRSGGLIHAHNAAFERLAWQTIMTPRYGWPLPRLEQFRCTAAMATAMALPRDLGTLGKVLALPVTKDERGKWLIEKFSKPSAPGRFNEPRDYPEEFEEFRDYCDTDVRVEDVAIRRMYELTDGEQALYELDQVINDRGLPIDMASVKHALKIAEEEKQEADRKMSAVTFGEINACTKVEAQKRWLKERGVHVISLDKDVVGALLQRPDIPEDVEQVLRLRAGNAKSSVSKLQAFENHVNKDGRMRGAFIFHKATTGRWASTGVQVHNLPRPRPGFSDLDIDTVFDVFRLESADALRYLYGDDLGSPMRFISDALRGFIAAPKGKDFICADYSAIELVVAAWLAGEEWKIDAARRGKDLHIKTAAMVLNVPEDSIGKHDVRRQLGKVANFGLQYKGGVAAFSNMAKGYGLNLSEMAASVLPSASDDLLEAADSRWRFAVKRGEQAARELSENEFKAAEVVKLAWRAANPRICAFWKSLEQACIAAIRSPGVTQRVDGSRLRVLVIGAYMFIRLPSRRGLCYPGAKLKIGVTVERPAADGDGVVRDRMDEEEAERAAKAGECVIIGDAPPYVSIMGILASTKQWRRFNTHGGSLFENVVQAVARDVLANGLRKAEANGYPVVLHVHDEIMAEVPEGWGDVGEFERLICELPEWAEGMPLSAEGWRGKRYRK